MSRIVFAGTPAIAAECLTELLKASAEADWELVGVLTRPDAPVGRRRKITPSPVAQIAAEAGLPVIKAVKVDAEVTAQLQQLNPSLGVVVAYGALLPQPALDVPDRGWVNLHYSALPKYRGAAPVQHTLLNREKTTAATVFQLEKGMDTGPIHGARTYEVPDMSSAGDVLEDLTSLGARMLVELIPDLLAGTSRSVPQQGTPSLAPKLTREDAFIDPTKPASELVGRINATIPEPGAWTFNGHDRMKLGVARLFPREAGGEPGEVKTLTSDRNRGEEAVVMTAGDGRGVVLSEVQPAGKRMMSATDWLRGQQGAVRLGGSA